ncbi:MAG: phosphonate C-P lyase system protein PhnG [Pseudomonadota bacterium]
MSEGTRDRGVDDAQVDPRRTLMELCAHARDDELSHALSCFKEHVEAARDVRPPDVGLVMVRGRMGGSGAPFNVGEATVSRAVVELESGEVGYGHVLGRDPHKAKAAALVDALGQIAALSATLEQAFTRPVSARLASERAEHRAKTDATKVDFFTLARGED